jgi:hypothetical protein
MNISLKIFLINLFALSCLIIFAIISANIEGTTKLLSAIIIPLSFIIGLIINLINFLKGDKQFALSILLYLVLLVFFFTLLIPI